MHMTQGESLAFIEQFKAKIDETADDREIVLCAPFTSLPILSKLLHGSPIRLGAQNIHWEEKGAYTGEIAGAMLSEIGVNFVVVGHSERRQYFGETDETANLRVITAQSHNLTPILCVGETKAQRQAGETESVIINQVKRGLVDVDQKRLVIAYEPIWAIGTGETCDAKEANRVISLIRDQLTYEAMPIQYGGSVKPDNIDEIMAQPAINGALVGGASLDPVGFARIVNFQVP
jgi:triosephosphate isomerase